MCNLHCRPLSAIQQVVTIFPEKTIINIIQQIISTIILYPRIHFYRALVEFALLFDIEQVTLRKHKASAINKRILGLSSRNINRIPLYQTSCRLFLVNLLSRGQKSASSKPHIFEIETIKFNSRIPGGLSRGRT